jgi:hypothetical protein
MNKKSPHPSDLEIGPIRHLVLPPDFIARVKAFKTKLGDADKFSLEQYIDYFRRDADPEGELAIWERLAGTFELFVAHNPTTGAIRREVLKVLVGTSLGMDDWSDIEYLSEDQVKRLVVFYRGLSVL